LESLGLVVLEAMAYGVPTLAITADGIKYRNANCEIITPDSDGLLASSEADFCHLLQSCITSPQRLSELGDAARRTYLERHQWPVVLDRWENLLRDITPVDSERSVQRVSSREALSPALVRT
jgi:glycosyltransferase involved in cell wall biosynthesis